jgi:hypothetical protein
LAPLTIEKAKTISVRRQIAEHELAEMQSEILTVAEVDEAWKRLAIGLKTALLTVVDEIKREMHHLTDHDEHTLRAWLWMRWIV